MNWLLPPNILITLLVLSGFIWPARMLAAGAPAAFEASYTVEKYKSTVAEMHLKLEHVGDRLVYTSQTLPRGLLDLFSDDKIFEQSTLHWDTERHGLQLLAHQYTRREKPKDNQQFSLSWNTAETADVTGMAHNKPFTLQLKTPAWDRLSVQLALMMDISRDKQPKDQYVYTVINAGKLEQYQFHFESEQKLSIGERVYPTLKFKREHSGNRMTYFWLAPALNYIPVRIEQHKKGELHFSMQLAKPVKVSP